MTHDLTHYAVWRGHSSMQPACDWPEGADRGAVHHITINRGDVDCPKCLRAMGGEAGL